MTTSKPSTTPVPQAAPAGPVSQIDPRLLVREQGFSGYLQEAQRRIRGGEYGSLPVIVGLILIWAVFQFLNPRFLSPQNLTNISLDIVPTGLIAVGIVFVLLLGEIDLSVGSVGGACTAILAVVNVNWGLNAFVSILLAVVAGMAMGLLHGFFFAKIGVPAFIVTLAGLLGWNGVMLVVFGLDGTINLDYNGGVVQLTTTFFGQTIVGYSVAGAVVALYLIWSLVSRSRRQAAGIPTRSVNEIVIRAVGMAILLFAVAIVLNLYKGLPLALVIFLAFVVLLDFVLRKTSFGRKVFALGGSVEASRRAGINVAAIRMMVFTVSCGMAAVGGVFFASRLTSANQSGLDQNVLMNAIAAAVIGGTSLFGGRGSTYSALLGVLVIQSIRSGMALEGIGNAIQFIVTGVVLLAAVTLDSVSRRSQKASGRA
ncbi:sugar ABC transporter permease [Fodinicola feengrottensis]|uniref:Xylose transport system permease protein XylH n=1 Tax=Fodinicola feengrottensis TaxID=435914 RepID=A0ABN2J3Y1_9ACTN|nr:sugar ABC transporter permease [Fodinicola feengrottensis]